MDWIKAVLKDASGLTSVEYGLVFLGIGGMVIASLFLVDLELNTLMPH